EPRIPDCTRSGRNKQRPDAVSVGDGRLRRRPIGLCADAQIRDDGQNMETYHENTYRSSCVGHADCGPDIRSPRERGSDVPGELLIRLERLLTNDKARSAAEGL